MSSLVVEVCRIDRVFTHPNADALELAQIKGWQCVIPKGRHQTGELVTYVPIDSLIPVEHSDRWGITKYLSHGRVRCARLRGEPSFGVILQVEDAAWGEGTDVADYYGIRKYEPPIRLSVSDMETPHALFEGYTDVENLRNFPEVMVPGEPVQVTEKIHGTNSRVGMVEGMEMAGSMGMRRKRPEELAGNIYWLPWTLGPVRELLTSLGAEHRQVVLYGEIFGSKIQNLDYGNRHGRLGYRAFDLLVDGRYLDAECFRKSCERFGVDMVPVLYEGAFDLETVRTLAEGTTTMGADHIREGVVVRPLVERRDPKIGRVCLKYVGDGYLFAKGVTDSQDV